MLIHFSNHALDRMRERSITRSQVQDALEQGSPDGPHHLDDGKIMMRYTLNDLVVVIGPDLSVITVYRTMILRT